MERVKESLPRDFDIFVRNRKFLAKKYCSNSEVGKPVL